MMVHIQSGQEAVYHCSPVRQTHHWVNHKNNPSSILLTMTRKRGNPHGCGNLGGMKIISIRSGYSSQKMKPRRTKGPRRSHQVADRARCCFLENRDCCSTLQLFFAEGDEKERGGLKGAPTALASLCIDRGHRHHRVRWALLAANVDNHFSGAVGSTFHLFLSLFQTGNVGLTCLHR